jgi:hypothetical protein
MNKLMWGIPAVCYGLCFFISWFDEAGVNHDYLIIGLLCLLLGNAEDK